MKRGIAAHPGPVLTLTHILTDWYCNQLISLQIFDPPLIAWGLTSSRLHYILAVQTILDIDAK